MMFTIPAIPGKPIEKIEQRRESGLCVFCGVGKMDELHEVYSCSLGMVNWCAKGCTMADWQYCSIRWALGDGMTSYQTDNYKKEVGGDVKLV